MVSADTSTYGLGAVLRQRTNGTLRPVACASRAMTPTEQRYSQIEKEALATKWSLMRFTDYLYGMSFLVETDHKPLVSLLSSKKNFRRTIAMHSTFSNAFDAIHVHDRSCTRKVPNHSRRPVACSSRATSNRGRRPIYGRSRDGTSKPGVFALPATENRLAEIRARQLEDDVCQQVMRYCTGRWPRHPSLPSVLRPYWQVQNELTIQNGLLLKGALYRIWCGVNRLGDSGVKVVWIDSVILQLLLSRRVSYC